MQVLSRSWERDRIPALDEFNVASCSLHFGAVSWVGKLACVVECCWSKFVFYLLNVPFMNSSLSLWIDWSYIVESFCFLEEPYILLSMEPRVIRSSSPPTLWEFCSGLMKERKWLDLGHFDLVVVIRIVRLMDWAMAWSKESSVAMLWECERNENGSWFESLRRWVQ